MNDTERIAVWRPNRHASRAILENWSGDPRKDITLPPGRLVVLNTSDNWRVSKGFGGLPLLEAQKEGIIEFWSL